MSPWGVTQGETAALVEGGVQGRFELVFLSAMPCIQQGRGVSHMFPRGDCRNTERIGGGKSPEVRMRLPRDWTSSGAAIGMSDPVGPEDTSLELGTSGLGDISRGWQ